MSLETLAAKCNSCGLRTFDYMASGWLTFSGALIKYAGRDKQGQAKTEIYLAAQRDFEMHFCSMACFCKYGGRKAHGK